ncbi:MAG TPA: plastocyanin/azurin family copper-binding protein [Solirubrobacter sp.]|jgi:plastocyanin|nr:plastocyanin/azurin family copper-binding protein [Solirubrobacter sp.]
MRRTFAAVAVATAAGLAVAPAHAGTTKTVSVKNNAFSPKTVSIKKGDKVAWKWTQGGVEHNVTPANGGRGSRTTSKKGYRYTKSFSRAGTFRYVCTLHSSMKMTVKVR